MNHLIKIFFKTLRKLYFIFILKNKNKIDNSQVEYFDQKANDLLCQKIDEAYSDSKGLMVCKFGTVELNCVLANINKDTKNSFKDYINFIRRYNSHLHMDDVIKAMGNNAGLFPANMELASKFTNRIINDIPAIDILGSYNQAEKYLGFRIDHCTKINIDSYCAPFLYDDPWTKCLKNKKVLILHPFVESIKSQYKNRELLFDNPNVLPEFKELILVKAVQSIGGVKTDFTDWFEALEYMKKEISSVDFDIAIIGAGAYGLPLTAHVKNIGKIGIHMAGWTQMLFGIYGNRWVKDQPYYSKFINENWKRPSKNETPEIHNNIESGCYW